MSQGLCISGINMDQIEEERSLNRILQALHKLYDLLIGRENERELISITARHLASEFTYEKGMIYFVHPVKNQLLGCKWEGNLPVQWFSANLSPKSGEQEGIQITGLDGTEHQIVQGFCRRIYSQDLSFDCSMFSVEDFCIIPIAVDQENRGEIVLPVEGDRAFPGLEALLAGDILGAALTRSVILERSAEERDRLELELVRGQKLESLGIMVGGIAHDFNNILTAISGCVSLAKMYLSPEDKAYKKLEQADKAFLQAKELTQQFLTFSKKGNAPVKKTIKLQELLEDACNFSLSGSSIKCDCIVSDDLMPVHADKGQISQVINNILINAKQAMPDGGVVTVRARNVVLDSNNRYNLKRGPYVRIDIEDQGIGIPEKDLLKIFDPYFTTKDSGNGLGLPTAYSIMKKHEGTITVDSQPGKGSVFSLFLPATGDSLAKEDSPKGKNAVPGKEKILIMDDEENIRELVGEMLETMGYTVSKAKDGKEAIETIRFASKSDNPFDAVILDLTVPGGMGGKDIIGELHKISPESKAIVTSGYVDDPVMVNFREYGFNEVIAKPYQIEDLSEVLRKALAQSSN